MSKIRSAVRQAVCSLDVVLSAHGKVRSLHVILGVPLAGVFLCFGVYTANVGVLFVSG